MNSWQDDLPFLFAEPWGYILDDQFQPQRMEVRAAIRLRHQDERTYRVAYTAWGDGTRVSTVLLSVDHWYEVREDRPTFETMIFPRERWDDYQARTRTAAEALMAHETAVREVTPVKGAPVRDDRITLPD